MNQILTEITKLTVNIETNYPELYQFLDEIPLTIPSEAHPRIDLEIMCAYLESLRELLRHHIENHSPIPST